jgi:hypothetical protein
MLTRVVVSDLVIRGQLHAGTNESRTQARRESALLPTGLLSRSTNGHVAELPPHLLTVGLTSKCFIYSDGQEFPIIFE